MRAIAALACVYLLVGCDIVREQQIIGTWRSEQEDGTVEEIAFQSDHTLVWWSCAAELATPQTVTDTAKWHVRQKQLVTDFNRGTAPLEHVTHQILKIGINTLVLKPPYATSPIDFHRIETPTCAALKSGRTPYSIESNISGTWRVHYHTHDFVYHFTPDHRVVVSGIIRGESVPMWNGSWKVSGSDLLVDLKSDSGITDQEDTWRLYDFQPRCFKIKDPDGVSYVVRKVN